MQLTGKVAVVTGAGSGIGQAVVEALAEARVKALALVDRSESVDCLARRIAESCHGSVATSSFIGDVTDPAFRGDVFDRLARTMGVPSICVPAAGITRDQLSVKFNKQTHEIEMYPLDTFRLVTEVNLLAPVYWALEMVGRIARDRFERGLGRWDPAEGVQGAIIFIGSVSSQGNRGQIAYAATKAGLEGAAATLTKEAIYHGVRCGVIHPGFTDTPMVRGLGEAYINEHILPQTQLRRLIRPREIADAIVFMIGNSAVSGELWADAGWHPTA
jgi:NAD(P)-dependent dehydrogenase (short-subunit alcohol dehydrogenase family)